MHRITAMILMALICSMPVIAQPEVKTHHGNQPGAPDMHHRSPHGVQMHEDKKTSGHDHPHPGPNAKVESSNPDDLIPVSKPIPPSKPARTVEELPPVKPLPPPPPAVEPIIGMYKTPLVVPRRADFYANWPECRYNFRYAFNNPPERLRASVKRGKSIYFEIDEIISSGHYWVPRYDGSMVGVEVIHRSAYEFGKTKSFGTPGYVQVTIKGRKKGLTMVEFVLVREWEWKTGAVPEKVIQMFVEVR